MSAEILTTTNYDIFRRMKGQRDVEPKRVNMLVDSIKQSGWISNPIMVNKKMEIVDGQGRFAALKRLGMPIEYYFVDKSVGLNECRVLNNNLQKWNTESYVMSYAEMGNKNYQRVKQLMEYFDVSLDVIMMAKDIKTRPYGHNGSDYKKMREGLQDFTESDYIYVSKILNIYSKYDKVFYKFKGRKNNRDRVIMYMIHYAEKYGTLDHERMLAALESCDPNVVYNTGFDRLLESVQNVYNFNKPKKTRLYFYEEYRIDKKLS